MARPDQASVVLVTLGKPPISSNPTSISTLVARSSTTRIFAAWIARSSAMSVTDRLDQHAIDRCQKFADVNRLCEVMGESSRHTALDVARHRRGAQRDHRDTCGRRGHLEFMQYFET